MELSPSSPRRAISVIGMTTDSSLDGGYTENEGPVVVRPGHPLRWRRLLFGLGAVHLMVVALSAVAPIFAGPEGSGTPFAAYFDVTGEGNFPAWWSVAQLAAAGTSLLFVAVLAWHQKIKGAAAWWILGGLVLILCLEEGTGLREQEEALVRQFADVPDMTFLWLALGVSLAVVVLVLAIISARHLPEESTRLIVLGITVLLFAAVGLGFVAGEFIRLGLPAITLTVLYHLEEFLELAAGSLLLVAPLAAVRSRTTGRSTSFTLMDRDRR